MCLSGGKYILDSFQPHSKLERFSSNKTIMRYLRYWEYPLSIESQEADIHHVIDHGYAHILPKLTEGKTCITVHDLIPMLKWKGLIPSKKSDLESINNVKKPKLNLYSLKFIKRYDRIISVSENTANDLVKHLGIDRNKICVIPPSIDSRYTKANKEGVDQFASQYGLDKNYRWIMISGREFYKNHETSLKVLKMLIDKLDLKVKLIKSGLPSPEFDTFVSSMNLENHVQKIFLKNINELPMLYNFVDCLLFPSLYEGFGMPVAESLACGTPVIISNKGSLPEVGGDLCFQFDPFDVEGMATTINEVITKKNIRKHILQKGPETMKKYSSNSINKLLNRFYENLINDKKNTQ